MDLTPHRVWTIWGRPSARKVHGVCQGRYPDERLGRESRKAWLVEGLGDQREGYVKSALGIPRAAER